MVLHVDDLNVFASTLPLLLDFKAAIKAQYDIHDIGEPKCFLGLEVSRDRTRRKNKLWPPKNISDIVAQFEIPNFGLYADESTRVGFTFTRPMPGVRGGESRCGEDVVETINWVNDVSHGWDETQSRSPIVCFIRIYN